MVQTETSQKKSIKQPTANTNMQKLELVKLCRTSKKTIFFRTFKTCGYTAHTHTHILRKSMNIVDTSRQQLSKTRSLVLETRPVYRAAEEPHNKPGGAENNSTDSQTLSEKSHNTRRWEHKNSKCSPPAPVAPRTGTADEERGTPGRAVWRPICSTTRAACSCRAHSIHHPPPSVPQFPSLSSQCSPTEASSSAK